MSTPTPSCPVSVVLPMHGVPEALLSAVDQLVAIWPPEVEAVLVVPSGPLTARDRAVLHRLGEDVQCLEIPGTPCFGELVHAAADRPGALLVLDPTELPDATALAVLLAGDPDAAGLLVTGEQLLAAPVSTAACSLSALTHLLHAAASPSAPSARPDEPRLLPRLAHTDGRPGVLSVVLALSGTPQAARSTLSALRRGTRVRLDVVVVATSAPAATRSWLSTQRDLTVSATTHRGPVADLNAAIVATVGENVLLLDEAVALPRHWADGLLRSLRQEGVAAIGPRGTFLSAEQGAGAGADPGTRPGSSRSQRDACSTLTRRLDASCLLVSRPALLQTGLLDEQLGSVPAAVIDLELRLKPVGHLVVADDVLIGREGATRPAPASDDDLQSLGRLWGPTLGHEVWLSAALIVKDEQAALPACLASLQGVVDEIVVCDTGSTDRTVEIAHAFGATVLTAAWEDDFAQARNAALSACRGVWVVSVDADEQLRLRDGADLRRQLLGLDGDTDAATLSVRSRSRTEGGPSFEHAAGRLFRRGRLRWVGAVHENLTDATTGLPPSYVPLEGAYLDHAGYLDEVYAVRDKGSRNLQLAEKDYARAVAGHLAERRWKAAYELARALSKNPEEGARVEALLREALVLMPPGLRHLRSDALVRLATVLAHDGRLPEAEQAGRDALAVRPGDPAALLVLCQVLAAAQRPTEALEVLDGPTVEDDVLLDLDKRSIDLPLLRARLLHALSRDGEAAAVLLEVAEHALHAMDWPLLHGVLAEQPDGLTLLAAQIALSPEAALAGLVELSPTQRRTLDEALHRHGVDVARHAPAAVRARRLELLLDGHDEQSLRHVALALEDTDPEAALQVWQRVPDSAAARVAGARCLLQLGRTQEAVTSLDGLQVDDLDLGDRLVVVALAAAAGDQQTARSLLEGAGDVPPTLRGTVDELARSLGLTG